MHLYGWNCNIGMVYSYGLKFIDQIYLVIILQVFTVYWKTIGPNRFKLNNVLNFGGRYIYTDDMQPSKYKTLCDKMVEQLLQSTFTIAAMIIIPHLLVGLVPFYLATFQNIRVSVMGIELPFFEPSSGIGYNENLSVQSAFGIVSIGVLLAIGIMVTLMFNNVIAIPELIHLELNNLENELNLNGMTLNAIIRLRNVLMKVQNFNG